MPQGTRGREAITGAPAVLLFVGMIVALSGLVVCSFIFEDAIKRRQIASGSPRVDRFLFWLVYRVVPAGMVVTLLLKRPDFGT